MVEEKIEDVYSLSPMQAGMLFHTLYSGEPGAYLDQQVYALPGNLNVDAFERAWQHLIERHSVLRTSFHWEGLPEALQVVHGNADLPLDRRDWSSLSTAEKQSRLDSLLKEHRLQGVELSCAPLMHLTLIWTGTDTWQFLWTVHHLLLDRWSISLLLSELSAVYSALCRGQRIQLPRLRPYGDYIGWLQEQNTERAEAYWRRALAGLASPTALPIDCAPGTLTGRGVFGQEHARLSAEATSALQVLARQHRLTLNTVLQGAWALLLSRYSGEEDVLFGATVSGRPASLVGVESMVGLFINSLPVRVRVPGSDSLVDWLQRLQDQMSEMREFEYSSIVQIQGWSGVARGTPLFESLVLVQNTPSRGSTHAPGEDRDQEGVLALRQIVSESSADFPLSLLAVPGPHLSLWLNYDVGRYDGAEIVRLLGHLVTLLEGMTTDPHHTLGSLPMLTEPERRQLLEDWNATSAEYPRDRCIHELFEEQVQRIPNATALVVGNQQLSYAQLNQRADRLAHLLAGMGVSAGVRVGLMLPRGVEMIVGILGILKAGGAYVSLDADYPPERVRYILQDSEASVLLTTREWEGMGADYAGRLVFLDEALTISPISPIRPVSPLDPAYVIYTSGSTGLPKGAVVTHRNLVHSTTARRSAYEEAPIRLLMLYSFAFDGSVANVFWTLCEGGCLVLPIQPVQEDLHAVLDLMVTQRISHCDCVPSLYRVFLEELGSRNLDALRTVIVGGEECSSSLVAQHFARLPHVPLYNEYGPTEVTVWASTWRASAAAIPRAVPIGRAIANTQLYVLDAHLRPVPVGVPGELYVGGAGVAQGYLGRASLTAERFVPNPFSTQAGSRLYRTGDLVRYLGDGNLVYLGRVDHQVKVRGFRIELGEIERTLEQHPRVRAGAVVLREDGFGEKELVAYVVAGEGVLTGGELREHLRTRLPGYMVPSAFVLLESLPLSASGKVDRKALPAPEAGAETGKEAAAARTPVEDGIAEIWREVLHREHVGIHDSFFEFGGHSLLATQVISRIRNTFQVELPLRALFEAPTIAELAMRIDEARGAETASAPPLVRVSREGRLPLSFSQQRLWFLNEYEPQSPVYNMAMALRLVGALDAAALEHSLTELVLRHESLRTTFGLADDVPVQVIHSEPLAPLKVVDLGTLGREVCAAESRRLIREESDRPFDLQSGPLFRSLLMRLDEEEHVLVLTMHHIVSDGWSMGVLRHELAALYNALHAERPSPLPELPIQYADYAAWQREWLAGETLERQISYWKERFTGAPTLLELPTDRPRPPVRTFCGAIQRLELSAELTEGLKALGQQEGSTLFMTLLAAFVVLLSRYSGQEDVVVGAPIANRTRSEVEGLIGFFLNTLALRTDLSGDPSFVELLGRVRESALGAYAHQDLPFEKLVEELTSERSLSHSPVFQVLFTFQNAPHGGLKLEGLGIEAVRAEGATAKFDLSVAIGLSASGLRLGLEYNTDLFDEERIERLLNHYRTLLEGIVADPEQRISTLPLLTQAERQQLLVDWNDTRCPFPDRRLHQLVEDQVDRSPEAPALYFEGTSLSYRELDESANRLAHDLRAFGVGPGSYVGVALERSFELVVSLLAVLKTGAAYIPIDLDYPASRIASMLQQAHVGVIVSREAEAARLPEHDASLVFLDLDAARLASRSAARPGVVVDAEAPAYVLYTSGSTGRPKGVVVPHRAILNHMEWMAHQFPLTPQDRVPLKTPISFDASVWECWGPLMAGAQLIVARPGGHTDPAYLVDLVRRHRITTIKLVPSLLQMLLEEEEFAACASLRQLFCGAEALTRELQDRFFARFGERVALHNLYGPTEAAIDATGFTCRPGWDRAPVPIGRPIANVQAYVLDRYLNAAPVGVAGELYLGGASLATGYLNGADLTAERFVPDPFGGDGGGRLYRTGDLVRTLRDGNLEFLGRIDYQVKVRGVRIELGEIESVLLQHPGVREVVALAREDAPGDTRLVAYLVAQNETLSVNELREHVLRQLPVYMVPSAFVWLRALPLTSSGKVDRKALPTPEAEAESGRTHVNARTPIEEGIAEIWREVLRLESVGVTDNFFELGGHSLLATQVISRVRAIFQVDLPLRTLFETPTIAGLAEHIDALHRAGVDLLLPPLVRVSRDAELPLSFSQQRLWFIDQLQPGSSLYNVPSVLRMNGVLDPAALQSALEEIFTRHEILRTRYSARNGNPIQLISQDAHFPLTLHDLCQLPHNERNLTALRLCREEAARPFDLACDPMIRAQLLRLGEQEHLLLLTLHHIASDGWSRSIVMRELSTLYNAFSAGRSSPLAELPIQYVDYAFWQRSWLQGEALQRQVDYWREQLWRAPPVLELPTDRPRESATSYDGASYRFRASSASSEGMRRLCRASRATPFMALLAAFQVLLYRWSGQSDLVVGTDVANRTEPQTEDLIGFFLNHLVLRTDLSGDPSFRELLGRVREVCLGAYAHQDLPFDKLVEVLQPERHSSHTPVFQVLFVLQNVPRDTTEWSGLTLQGTGGIIASSKFDLSLFLSESGEGLGGTWVYRTDLFEAESIRRLSGQYLGVLDQVFRNPDMAIEDVELVLEEERRVHESVGRSVRSRGTARRAAVIVEAEGGI